MKRAAAAIILMLLLPAGPAAGADDGKLHVYLPRDITVDGGTMTLATVAIVRCADKELAEKARAVALGRSPLPKERLVLDRPTILSRLASSGIRGVQVRITGASAVRVSGKAKIISAETLRRCAEELIKRQPPQPAGGVWQFVRGPAEMVLAVATEPELKAELAGGSPRHHLAVKIVARVGGKEVASATALFRRMYRTRRAVAVRVIRPGQKIMPEDIKIETVMTTTPQQADWTPPYGMVPRARILPGTVIRQGLIGLVGRAIAVRRNQKVIMKIIAPGLAITARGLALEDGRVGESIRVRNTDSQRIVVAKVASDGTVTPMIEASN